MMRSAGANDRLALLLFLPLWLACFGFSLNAAIRHTGYPPVYVTGPDAADEYPVVAELKTAHRSPLRVGDRLLSVDGRDLRNVGSVGLAVQFAAIDGAERQAEVRFESGGRDRRAVLSVPSYAEYWPRLPASAAFALTAMFLLLRARRSSMMRHIVYCYMCVALLLACTFAAGTGVTLASIAVHVVSFSLAVPLAVRAAQMFPQDEEEPERWRRVAPWIFALIGPLDASRFYAFPFSRRAGIVGVTAIGLASVAALIVVTLRNYRRADPIGRRQIKWFLLGAYCALAPPVAATVLATIDARFTPVLVVSLSALGFIPLFLLVAIARFNLFDVDRLISATASYTILGVLLLAGLLVGVPRLAYAIGRPIGVEPAWAQMFLSLTLAAVLVPVHTRLRPRVDRVFFAERHALELGVEDLLDHLSDCRSPEQLVQSVGRRLDDLLRPEICAVYARAGEGYSPAFGRGKLIPAAFPSHSPLIAALAEHSVPLALSGGGRQRPSVPVDRFDRATLETLGVDVIVPVRRNGNLVAFICLGSKRSGDVYTSTDLALLAAIADKVSNELMRFDQAEVIRQAREMQDVLRRYVPGAVAEELVSGRPIDVGERDLAILFVDIRGYTSYAETRRAAEVFSTVNRYTEVVSQVVQSEGGSLVEFNGDGMMAVFGAPRRLDDKERAAVEAGRKIVAAVAQLDADGGEAISVGVGIATGEAFVGNVQAVDRLIWTAIGNTTNLAARLQALSRDLEAAVVIDVTTWRRAGGSVRDFILHASVPIRGRRHSEDVYALPYEMPASTEANREDNGEWKTANR